MKRASLTFRLTLLFASASTIVLLALGFLIGASVEQHFAEQDMTLLSGRLDRARHALESVRVPADFDAVPQQLDEALVGHHGLAVAVLTPKGETLFATSGADFPQALLDRQRPQAQPELVIWNARNGQPLRGFSAWVQTGIPGAVPVLVALATDISHHQHFMRAFRVTLWSFVALAAALTGFLGWVAAQRGLAPLQKIRHEAAAITAQRLHARLAVDSVPMELADLADTLNAMLARLEDSFLRLSAFSSDLAHELRTPVSNLLTQTQVTLSKARDANEYRNILASNAEEFERLSRMIADMLFLAKSDNHLIVPQREAVDLVAEASKLLTYYEALAEEKRIALSVSGQGTVWGDRLMLQRAIHNLLSNAVRHTPANGRVAVHIADRTCNVMLSVENTGDAVPPEHLPRLFDRFYRVDAARHRSADGVGLGLAITRAIVVAHGGDVAVRSENGVTVFDLILPNAAP